MKFHFALQLAVNAAAVSALYGLLAVAYVLMHGVTRRVNIAFGAISVWAGYLTIDLAATLGELDPYDAIPPLAGAAGYAIFGAVALGAAIERLVIRPLIRSTTLAMMIATLGLAIFLDEALRLAHDSSEAWLSPVFSDPLPLGPEGGAATTGFQIFVTLTALAFAAFIIAFMARSPFGRLWRAVSQDLAMAELSGVDVARVARRSFALASAAAAIAGALNALYYGEASFYSGLAVGLKTLFVAVVGGLDSIGGAFLAAILLGLFETAWSGYVGEEWRDVASFLALSGLLILCPEGVGSAWRRGNSVTMPPSDPRDTLAVRPKPLLAFKKTTSSGGGRPRARWRISFSN